MEGKWRGKEAETVIILVTAFCVVMACVSIYTVSSMTHQRPPQAKPASGLITGANVKIGTLNNVGRGQEKLDGIVKEDLVIFSINATSGPQTGDSKANLLIENPPDNETRFITTVTRNDTDEKIYQSGYLNLRRYIGKTPLDVVLPKGEYPCTASFSSYRVEGSSYLRRATAKIAIYVLN